MNGLILITFLTDVHCDLNCTLPYSKFAVLPDGLKWFLLNGLFSTMSHWRVPPPGRRLGFRLLPLLPDSTRPLSRIKVRTRSLALIEI
jgi:hypothetical protein